jgi:glycerol-1-phosphatase
VLVTALDRQPDEIVGKPAPALFQRAARDAGANRPLVVGDRLDTDIAGAHRAGMDSLLVLTGVSTPTDLLGAPEGQRPTYLAQDLAGLYTVDEAVRVPQENGWRVRQVADGLALDGAGAPLDALRALCGVAWTRPPGGRVIAEGRGAADAIRALGLAT